MTPSNESETKLVFCGKCEFYDGSIYCHKEENKRYIKSPIREYYECGYASTINIGNKCKYFKQKEIKTKKSFWSKLKFW